MRYYRESAVCRRLAKGVLFVAMRVCQRRVAIAGHVIKLNLTRRGNTLALMESRPFLVYRRCGDDGGYSVCDSPAPVSALCPRVEISPVAVVVLALACLNKNNNNNNN